MLDYNEFQILVDVPTQNPELNFKGIATGLASVILNSKPQFAMAIYGEWGSGKTTLMNAIRNHLDENSVDDAKQKKARTGIVAVDFSAWRYEKEEHLIVPLLDTIREALVMKAMEWEAEAKAKTAKAKKFKALGNVAKETAKTVGAVIASVLAGFSFKLGISDALSMSYDANKALSTAARFGKNKTNEQPANGNINSHESFSKRLVDENLFQSLYHACFKALANSFQQFQKVVKENLDIDEARIVIFVDDLDRCLPRATLQVLESMKLFFDLQGFVFVTGLDRRVVERSIEACYSLNAESDSIPDVDSDAPPLVSGRDYLKKIFQVPYSLRPVNRTAIGNLLHSFSETLQLPQIQKDDINTRIHRHIKYLFPQESNGTPNQSGINPREVKRYINAYTIQMKIDGNLNADSVLALNTLYFRRDCEKIYDALRADRKIFSENLKNYLADKSNPSPLEIYQMTSVDIPEDIAEYLEMANGGGALLDEYELERYLELGESLTSSAGGRFLDLLPAYHRLRGTLRKAVAATDANDLRNELDNARKQLQDLSSFEGERGVAVSDLENWVGAYSSFNSSLRRLESEIASSVNATGQEATDIATRIESLRESVSEELKTKLDAVYQELRNRQREYAVS